MQELDAPLYRTPQELAKTLGAQTPPLAVVWSALMNAGYKVSSTHCCPGAFKTDAPTSIVWDMMKSWVYSRRYMLRKIKMYPVKQEKLDARPDSPAARILSVPATYSP